MPVCEYIQCAALRERRGKSRSAHGPAGARCGPLTFRAGSPRGPVRVGRSRSDSLGCENNSPSERAGQIVRSLGYFSKNLRSLVCIGYTFFRVIYG